MPIADDEEVRKLQALADPLMPTTRAEPLETLREALKRSGDVHDEGDYSGAWGVLYRAVGTYLTAADPAPAGAGDREERLRKAVGQLHRWDVSQGWAVFNAILADIDAALAAADPAPAGAQPPSSVPSEVADLALPPFVEPEPAAIGTDEAVPGVAVAEDGPSARAGMAAGGVDLAGSTLAVGSVATGHRDTSYPSVSGRYTAAPAGASGDVDAAWEAYDVFLDNRGGTPGQHRVHRAAIEAALRATPATPPEPLREAVAAHAIDSCIYIVEQSLDTAQAEKDYGSVAAREHVIRLLTSYRATIALSSSTPPEAAAAKAGLGEAWEAAEAALPDGWALHLGRNPSGTRYDARAKQYGVWPSNGAEIEADGDTPADALRALAARLHPRPTDSAPSAGEAT